jgi:hypothetical protein
MEEQAKLEAKWEEESKMGTIGASGIGTMLFQHQVCSHLFMVLFCGRFFVSSKSTLVAKISFSGFLCRVQVSSCFFLGILVVSILIYFL